MVLAEAAVFATPFDATSTPIPKQTPRYILQVGEVIETAERSFLSWVRVCSSGREGWVEIFQTITDANDPRKQTTRVQLLSLDRLTHSRHGAVRPFGRSSFLFFSCLNPSSQVSTCGHGLHLECWTNFIFTNMQQRQRQQDESSTDQGEVVCPLCKTVANGILPCHLPLLAPHTSVDQQTHIQISFVAWQDQCHFLEGRVSSNDSSPAFDLLVADHCLAKSQLSPTPDLSFGVLGEVGKHITSLRQLQALWSAVGYTLLSAIMALNDSTQAPDRSMSKLSMVVVDQLFRCSQRAAEWLSSEFDYRATVLTPLRDLLFSSEICSLKLPHKCDLQTFNQDALSRFLSLQPLPVVAVGDAINPEDSEVLRQAFRALPSIGFDGSQSLWPLLRQPLLSQDLFVIAIALVSNSGNLGEALHLSSLLCLVRLCQILLEPCSPAGDSGEVDVGKKRARIPSDQTLFCFVPDDLEWLRVELYAAAGVPSRGQVDETSVQDSWVPFLKFICQLRDLLTHQASSLGEPGSAGSEWGIRSCDSSDLILLLQAVGLGGLVVTITSGSVDQKISMRCQLLREACATWAKQYNDYYDPHDHSGGEESPSFPTAQVNPQATAIQEVREGNLHASQVPEDEVMWLELNDSEHDDENEEEDDDDLEEGGIEEGVDAELFELANDPALLLHDGAQDVNMMDIREWLLDTGLAGDSEEIQQLLNSFDRNMTRGSQLCGVDPVESPFRPSSGSLISSVPPLVGSISGLRPFLGSSRQQRLSAVLYDDSHLGVGLRHRIRLYDLPEKYTDLYQMASILLPPCALTSSLALIPRLPF
jgi:hypothetical protein